MSDNAYSAQVFNQAARIVAAYVSNHHVSFDELSTVINKVYDSLKSTPVVGSMSSIPTTQRPYLAPRDPFVPINESVFDDYIICLEDGKQLQMLKRHLSTMYGMTLDQYRERWNLPADYPMVSPKYALRRSEIARTTGLGHTSKKSKIKKLKGASTLEGQEQVGFVKN